MSIYIADMDMPKGEAVALYVYPDGRVKLWRPQAMVSHEYQAIPVSPHGRLIDVDALLSQYKGNIWTAKTDYAEGLRDVAKDIADAPTIIPAEEGKT